MLVGNKTPPAQFPIEHNFRTKILQRLLPITLLSLVQMTSNWVQRHILWSYRPYQNLGQVDHNLHDHVSYDVICKPPIHGNYPKYMADMFVPAQQIHNHETRHALNGLFPSHINRVTGQQSFLNRGCHLWNSLLHSLKDAML